METDVPVVREILAIPPEGRAPVYTRGKKTGPAILMKKDLTAGGIRETPGSNNQIYIVGSGKYKACQT